MGTNQLVAVTSTDLERPATLIDVRTGEVLPATPDNAIDLLKAARDIRQRILDLVKACEFVLREESQRQGKKTLHLPGGTAQISGGAELEWDLDILAELQALGLPEDRYGELVVQTVSYKVSAAVAKQLEAANESYAAVIRRARSYVEKPFRVSIK
jgi:hypothetical protein